MHACSNKKYLASKLNCTVVYVKCKQSRQYCPSVLCPSGPTSTSFLCLVDATREAEELRNYERKNVEKRPRAIFLPFFPILNLIAVT